MGTDAKRVLSERSPAQPHINNLINMPVSPSLPYQLFNIIYLMRLKYTLQYCLQRYPQACERNQLTDKLSLLTT